ncbi:TlpA disulfide reductase family protein [Bowmanella yangjiangensis]|uniref:TlpA family protein disulfide reductase n=1 Tax=Bowmanella yangjiangensis TaxID=2811230 RepID=A0ABS3CRR6_9ALTE|nr:TlpA disulfide reductase family protein [Bowmanella yangjiangensis]MBN7819808.1 TlpA family protein disulfide reductase [Bowmanella yangjiangensis]
MHFWATWCPYCKRLQPGLDRLAELYADKGLQVIAVSLSEKNGAMPQSVLIERGLKLKTLIDGDDLGLHKFSISGTPTTVFVSPDGKILGATMQSDPEDPQWNTVAEYLTNLPR